MLLTFLCCFSKDLLFCLILSSFVLSCSLFALFFLLLLLFLLCSYYFSICVFPFFPPSCLFVLCPSIFSGLVFISSLCVFWQQTGDTKAAGPFDSQHTPCLRVLNGRQPRCSLVCQRRGAEDVLGLNSNTGSWWQPTWAHWRQLIVSRCSNARRCRLKLMLTPSGHLSVSLQRDGKLYMLRQSMQNIGTTVTWTHLDSTVIQERTTRSEKWSNKSAQNCSSSSDLSSGSKQVSPHRTPTSGLCKSIITSEEFRCKGL